MLDEPVNGLDPEGIQWVRNLLKQLAAEGRTVFVSSHLMSEMAQTAEHLIVIGRGQLLADTGVEEFVQSASKRTVRVRSPQLTALTELIAAPDVTITVLEPSTVEITGLDSEQIGRAAAENSITLYELTPEQGRGSSSARHAESRWPGMSARVSEHMLSKNSRTERG
jgi:ABC-2 type transport system ATP-binding protein